MFPCYTHRIFAVPVALVNIVSIRLVSFTKEKKKNTKQKTQKARAKIRHKSYFL